MSKLFIPFLTTLLLLTTVFPLSSALSCSSPCNNGNCVSGNICACESGYFNSNSPCNTRVPSLQNKAYIRKLIPANSWIYYYIRLDDVTSDVQLKFQVQSGTNRAYYLLQEHDSYDLPTNSDTSFPITPTGGDNTFTYSITKPDIDATNGGWLTLGIYNNGASQAEISAQYIATINPNISDDSDDSDDDSNGIGSGDLMRTVIVLPVIAVAIFFCAGVYLTAKARRRRLMMQQRIHLQANNPNNPNQNYEVVVVMNGDEMQFVAQNPQHLQNFQAHLHQHFQAQHQGVPHPHMQGVPQQIQGVPLQVLQKQKFLTKHEIQHYFPKKAFSQLETPFPQAACSICLDDFKPESICHELYCFHVFHENCIEEWLAKHDSCPDCRKPITKEAIRKFFREKKQSKQLEQSLPVHQ